MGNLEPLCYIFKTNIKLYINHIFLKKDKYVMSGKESESVMTKLSKARSRG